jgi:glycerol-3-phosphate dehydrogenase
LVPLLNVFGGKITTYRGLAESALAKLTTYFPTMGPPWTADAALPGGVHSLSTVSPPWSPISGPPIHFSTRPGRGD